MHHYDKLTDEELLLSARLGNHRAEAVFAERMFADRFRNCYFVALEASRMLDEWQLNEAYFRAYLNSVQNYRFVGTRFLTYFYTNLKNEIVHEATKKAREDAMRGPMFSLDAIIRDEEDSISVLSDFVPSTDMMDDPHAFLIYAERLESLNRLPSHLDPMSLDVMRLISAHYSFQEVAQICGISVNRVKYLITRFRRWVFRSERLIQSHSKKKKTPPSQEAPSDSD